MLPSHQNKTLVVVVVVNGSKCFCKPRIHSRLYVSWAVNQINISTKPVLSCSHCMFMTKLSCHEAEWTGAELHAVQPVSTVQVSVSTFLSVKPFDISDEGPWRFSICKRDITRYFWWDLEIPIHDCGDKTGVCNKTWVHPLPCLLRPERVSGLTSALSQVERGNWTYEMLSFNIYMVCRNKHCQHLF